MHLSCLVKRYCAPVLSGEKIFVSGFRTSVLSFADVRTLCICRAFCFFDALCTSLVIVVSGLFIMLGIRLGAVVYSSRQNKCS